MKGAAGELPNIIADIAHPTNVYVRDLANLICCITLIEESFAGKYEPVNSRHTQARTFHKDLRFRICVARARHTEIISNVFVHGNFYA